MTSGRKGLLFGLMQLFAGCAALPGLAASEDGNAPLIAPGRQITLPRPADLGRAIEVTQLITAKLGGNGFTFEARLSINADRLMLVTLDPTGRRALTIRWDGRKMAVERAPWLPADVRPGNLLADIVVLYFPVPAVRQALAAAGCELAISGRTRAVRCDEADVLRAEYGGRPPWAAKLTYSHLAWGYDIEVQSAEVSQ